MFLCAYVFMCVCVLNNERRGHEFERELGSAWKILKVGEGIGICYIILL